MPIEEQWIGLWPEATEACIWQEDIGRLSNEQHGTPIAVIHVWTDDEGDHVEFERIDQ